MNHSKGERISVYRSTKIILLWTALTVILMLIGAGSHSVALARTSSAFSSGGKMLLTGSNSHTRILQDVQSAAPPCINVMEQGNTSTVTSMAFSPNGERLVTGSKSGSVNLWDVQSGTLLYTLQGLCAMRHSVAFSPDGKMLVTSTGIVTALWDAQSGALLRTLQGDGGRGLIFS